MQKNYDEEMVKELIMYIENNSILHDKRFEPIKKNLDEKWNKGKYDFEKSIIYFMQLVNDGAKAYHQSLSYNGKWHHTFPMQDRQEVAKRLAYSFLDEVIDEIIGWDALIDNVRSLAYVYSQSTLQAIIDIIKRDASDLEKWQVEIDYLENFIDNA